ncbi:hypothetical protein A3A66_03740 [Microgenomates group bacterium RIFCSPLOWO2_01_FULL_46_13]|nr:MAG: hypothetical protein A2783_00430 [Microgenomates group bacterium RIFCSPHIGHO2_01_FULL_45_11]OGV95177.1 MAG: hypothetical protein A3A66_03740 [Microgenomates group bacterium RIFCSPLOWO2_01_FULL_46_13]
MNEYLSQPYLYGIIDHPFDIVELTSRIWILIVTLLITANFYSAKDAYQLTILLGGSITIFLFHLLCQKINPHRFHSPLIKSINVPLAERIRSNNLYLFASSLYLINFILSWLGLTPNLNNVTLWLWLVEGINFITVAVFIGILLLYLGTLKPALKKIPVTFLLPDLIILGAFCLYFIFLVRTEPSFEIASKTFGRLLLGSITLIAAKDLFIGKWTHNLPIATK